MAVITAGATAVIAAGGTTTPAVGSSSDATVIVGANLLWCAGASASDHIARGTGPDLEIGPVLFRRLLFSGERENDRLQRRSRNERVYPSPNSRPHRQRQVPNQCRQGVASTGTTRPEMNQSRSRSRRPAPARQAWPAKGS